MSNHRRFHTQPRLGDLFKAAIAKRQSERPGVPSPTGPARHPKPVTHKKG